MVGHAAQARLARWHGEWARAVPAWGCPYLGAAHTRQGGLPLSALVVCGCEGSGSCHEVPELASLTWAACSNTLHVRGIKVAQFCVAWHGLGEPVVTYHISCISYT